MVTFKEIKLEDGTLLVEASIDQLFQEAARNKVEDPSLASKYEALAQYRNLDELIIDDLLCRWFPTTQQRLTSEIPEEWLKQSYAEKAEEYERSKETDLVSKLENLWNYLHKMEEQGMVCC